MKKNISLCSKLVNRLKRSTKKNQNPNHLSNVFGKVFTAGFIAVLSLISVSQAQQVVAATGFATRFNEDKAEIQQARTNMNAIREEKREVKELENIPESIIEKFKANYPKATNVEWTAPGSDIEADFTDGNHHDVAFYDDNTSELIGTGHYLSFDNLPAKAVKKINRDFPGYTPAKVMYYDDNEDNGLAEALMEFPIDQDVYLVKMKNGSSIIDLQVTLGGDVSKIAGVK